MAYKDPRNNAAVCIFKKQGIITDITPAEKLFFIRNITQFGVISEAKEKALSEAQARYPKESLHNGIGDAFRHCYLSALLTRDVGEAKARELTDLHEDWCGNPGDERKMDLHNNAVGIAIARKVTRSFPDASLADLCAGAASRGELQVLKSSSVEQ